MSERRPTYDIDHALPPAVEDRYLPGAWYGVEVYVTLAASDAASWRGKVSWTNVVGLLLASDHAAKGEVFIPWTSIREVARSG